MASERIKRLGDLLAACGASCDALYSDVAVCGVTDDSRQVKPGTLFVAVAGLTVDGHLFIGEAVKKGCAAVLVCREVDDHEVPIIHVDDTMAALGFIAAAFYDYPANSMKMIGITGTNGKTTSSYLLEAVIAEAGGRPGVIGTVSVRYQGEEFPALLTTPPSVELQRTLRRMADSGVTHVAMEVSSHALARHRVNGIFFDVALFTNLSRDHLDFHGSMESYFSQKEKLFSRHLKKNGKGVVVLDGMCDGESEERWSGKLVRMMADVNYSFLTCGIGKGLIQARNFHYSLEGICAEIVTPEEQCRLKSQLVGEFNLKNLLGAIGCGVALGWDLDTICLGLNRADSVPGRMERVTGDKNSGVKVFVDYAHTPDALEKALQTLRDLNPLRFIVVFGCGGDRDRGKRPLMGEVAAQLADVILLTTDNARTESPRKILQDIEQGVKKGDLALMTIGDLKTKAGQRGYVVVEKRDEAIGLAITCAETGDVVFISGKGHENYQIIGTEKYFFDDRQQARLQLERL